MQAGLRQWYLFYQDVLERGIIEAQVSDEMLEAPILIFELL